MNADLVAVLIEATLAGSAALLLVLSLRRPVRAALGAGAAYALWLCVPVALLAVALPRSAEVPLALPVAWQIAPAMAVAAAPEPQAAWTWRDLLAPLWLAGALASAATLGWQQRRFRRALGPLRRRADGLYQSATATAGLPAVAGVLRPRILLPADFERRYSPQEQALVLQHERVHVRRGDLVANALAASLRCLFWFNPLLAWALPRFRLDQELACDARVIARNPRARRQYGEAMLKTHFDELPLPLGCHWQARHPIKERIDMLKRPSPSPLHWMLAMLFAIGLSASVGYASWAAQPAQVRPVPAVADQRAYAVNMRSDVDGHERRFQIREQAGKVFGVRVEESGSPVWEGDFTIRPLPDPQVVMVSGVVRADGKVVSEPALAVTLGKAATIQLSTLDGRSIFTLEATVDALAGGIDAIVPAQAPAADEQVPVAQDRTPPPAYPRDALRHGRSGRVIALVDVDAQGVPTTVEMEGSEPEGVFDASTIAAIRQWRFKPAMENGRPVAGRIRVPVDFQSGMTAANAPAGVGNADDFRWFLLSSADSMKAVCDVLHMGHGDAQAPVYCGIRKELAAR